MSRTRQAAGLGRQRLHVVIPPSLSEALALLFGLYSMIYGFSQITAGAQVRQLGKSFRPLSELKDAA
jgi:hypothetical protein